jgi:hypothetical protein
MKWINIDYYPEIPQRVIDAAIGERNRQLLTHEKEDIYTPEVVLAYYKGIGYSLTAGLSTRGFDFEKSKEGLEFWLLVLCCRIIEVFDLFYGTDFTCVQFNSTDKYIIETFLNPEYESCILIRDTEQSYTILKKEDCVLDDFSLLVFDEEGDVVEGKEIKPHNYYRCYLLHSKKVPA